jgi:hypothetical protein
MICLSTNLFISSSITVLYVVAGNGRLGGENDGFLVIFQGNITSVSAAPGATFVFAPDPTANYLQEYPTLGNQDPTSVGIGNMGLFQSTDEVGTHNHQQFQAGTPSTAPPGLSLKAGPSNEGGPNTNNNNGGYTFTRPAYTIGGTTYPAIGLSVPKTMNNLPYNLGVTMCIKT